MFFTRILSFVFLLLFVTSCAVATGNQDPSRADSVWFSVIKTNSSTFDYQTITFLNNHTVILKDYNSSPAETQKSTISSEHTITLKHLLDEATNQGVGLCKPTGTYSYIFVVNANSYEVSSNCTKWDALILAVDNSLLPIS